MATEINATSPGAILLSMPRGETIFWCVAFSFEALVILGFNGVTIAVFVKTSKLRNQTTILLPNLAVADLLVGLIAIPGWVYFLGGMFGFWINHFTLPLNIAYSAIDIFAAFASVSNHGCIAVERVIATFMPLKHRSVRKQLNKVFVTLVWVLALIVPVLTNVGFYVLPGFAFYVWMPFLCLLLLVILVCYCFLIRRMRNIQRDLGSDSERNRRFTITILIITIVSLATWLPFMILSTLNLLSPINQDLRLVNPVKFLHFANSLVNPFIYWFRIPNYKRSVNKLIFRRDTDQGRTRQTPGGGIVTHL